MQELGVSGQDGHTHLRILPRNINNIPPSKLALWDTLEYLQSFDVIMLCETCCVSISSYSLPGYNLHFKPASKEGKAGQGILVAIKDMHHCNITH